MTTGVSAAADLDDMDGDGTEDDPYVITDVHELQAMNDDLEAHYELGNDIDASETSEWDEGFYPIGDSPSFGERDEDEFAGSLDGQGYVIDGLYIDRPDERRISLIGYNEGTIKNIGLVNADITSDEYVSGLVADNNGPVIESYSTGDVTGGIWVGGLVGVNRDDGGEVIESYSTGDVTGESHVGGLVGYNNDGEVSESYSTGEVTGDGERRVGGLVGRNTGEVSESYSTGDVTGDDEVGGFVGLNSGEVSESYSTGDVTGDDEVGGFVGHKSSGEVIESYSTGAVSGDDEVGGFVGLNSGEVIESYWDTESSGQDESEGGTGLTQDQMTGDDAPDNMDGFDFDNTWDTVDDDYPILSTLEYPTQFGVSLISPDFRYSAVGEDIDFISILEDVDEDDEYEVEWDFGDGNTQTVNDTELATHEYDEHGEYTVKADIEGDEYTTNITVTDDPVANFSISPDNIVDGQNATFDASESEDTESAGLEPISQLSVVDGLAHWIPHEEGIEDAAYGATHETGDITITTSHDTSTGTSGAYQPEDELRIVNNYDFTDEWTISAYIDWQDTLATYPIFGSDNNDGVIIQEGDIKRVVGDETIDVTEFEEGYWQITHDGSGTFDYYFEGDFVASDTAGSIAPSSTTTLAPEKLGEETQDGSIVILDDVRIYDTQLPSADRSTISDHEGTFEQAPDDLEYFWSLNGSILAEDRETWNETFTEGDYEMELEVMDPDGRTDTVESVFEVLGTEQATISAVSPEGLQTDREVTISANIGHSLLDGGDYDVDVTLVRYDVINDETETLVDKTINENQTVSYDATHDDVDSIPDNHDLRERYSYQWFAENQEGIDAASETKEYSVIGNLFVSNSDGNLITTDTTVNADGSSNTASDGIHDISNFVSSQTDLQLDVSSDEYANTSTYLRHIDRSEAVLLYDENDELFDKDFEFDNSLLGGDTSFDHNSTYLVASKQVDGVSHTVDASLFGASDSATLQVRDGDQYTISLVDEDKSRSLGSFTANKDTENETETLRPAPIELDLGEGWQQEVSTEYRNETDDGLINIKFDSGDVNVTSLRIEVVNNNNDTIEYQETLSQRIETHETDVIVDDPNTTYTVSFEVYNEDTGETESVSTVVNILYDTILDVLPDSVTTWISIIILLAVAGTLGMISAPFGIIAVVAIGGVFTIIGWLPVSMTVVLQAATIAILFYISTRRQGL